MSCGNRMRGYFGLTVILVAGPAVSAGQNESPTPSLQQRLEDLDRRASEVRDLVASFEERKHTALLKKPLVSTGQVRIVGSKARWDTKRPHRSVMVMDAATIRIFYPQRRAMEIYDLDERLARLAISPVPRVSTLQEYFTIEEISPNDVDVGLSTSQHLALRLAPKDEALRDYLEHIDVAIELKTSFLIRARIIDPDGDETELTFGDVVTNSGLSVNDLKLIVPDGTTISRPLAGLRGEAANADSEERP